jgi:hypothetical protein
MHRVWGRFDHGRPTDAANEMLLLAAMAVLLAVVLAAWLRASRRPKRRFLTSSSRQLFRELSRAHELSFSKRRLLKRLAAARGVASPALLFVEPNYFDASTLPSGLQPAAKDLQRLRQLLFDE